MSAAALGLTDGGGSQTRVSSSPSSGRLTGPRSQTISPQRPPGKWKGAWRTATQSSPKLASDVKLRAATAAVLTRRNALGTSGPRSRSYTTRLVGILNPKKVRTTYAHRSLARRSRSFLVNPSRRQIPDAASSASTTSANTPFTPAVPSTTAPAVSPEIQQYFDKNILFKDRIRHSFSMRQAVGGKTQSTAFKTTPAAPVPPSPPPRFPFVVASGARPAIQHNPGSND